MCNTVYSYTIVHRWLVVMILVLEMCLVRLFFLYQGLSESHSVKDRSMQDPEVKKSLFVHIFPLVYLTF